MSSALCCVATAPISRKPLANPSMLGRFRTAINNNIKIWKSKRERGGERERVPWKELSSLEEVRLKRDLDFGMAIVENWEETERKKKKRGIRVLKLLLEMKMKIYNWGEWRATQLSGNFMFNSIHLQCSPLLLFFSVLLFYFILFIIYYFSWVLGLCKFLEGCY